MLCLWVMLLLYFCVYRNFWQRLYAYVFYKFYKNWRGTFQRIIKAWELQKCSMRILCVRLNWIWQSKLIIMECRSVFVLFSLFPLLSRPDKKIEIQNVRYLEGAVDKPPVGRLELGSCCCFQCWGLKWATWGSCELSKNWVKVFTRFLRVWWTCWIIAA